MIPTEFRLRPARHAAAHLRVVAALLRDRRFASVVNACDAGREGELIFRYLQRYAGDRMVAPGYVGLSLIQSLGYGIPMLIARDEPHSPEIEALAEGENGSLFASDSPDSLAGALVEMVAERQLWLSRREAIAEQVRSTYTVEHMVAAFASAIRGDRGARSNSMNDVPR